jgi:hypothetical protein
MQPLSYILDQPEDRMGGAPIVYARGDQPMVLSAHVVVSCDDAMHAWCPPSLHLGGGNAEPLHRLLPLHGNMVMTNGMIAAPAALIVGLEERRAPPRGDIKASKRTSSGREDRFFT